MGIELDLELPDVEVLRAFRDNYSRPQKLDNVLR